VSEQLRDSDAAPDGVGIGTRVRVYPGTDDEIGGVIADDFGDTSGHPVKIGEHQIAGAARRWAVYLDGGRLLFVDSPDLVAE
jgi:hypothetical protein